MDVSYISVVDAQLCGVSDDPRERYVHLSVRLQFLVGVNDPLVECAPLDAVMCWVEGPDGQVLLPIEMDVVCIRKDKYGFYCGNNVFITHDPENWAGGYWEVEHLFDDRIDAETWAAVKTLLPRVTVILDKLWAKRVYEHFTEVVRLCDDALGLARSL